MEPTQEMMDDQIYTYEDALRKYLQPHVDVVVEKLSDAIDDEIYTRYTKGV